MIPQAFASQTMALSAMGFTTILPSRIADRTMSIAPRSLLITFDDAYASLDEHVFPLLERAGFRAAVFVPTRMIGKSISCNRGSNGAQLPLMTADRIRYWAARGFEFGAHTRTHADLTGLDPAQIDDEVNGSRDDLSEVLDRPVSSFAYPFGKYDVRSARLVSESFPIAFTVEPGLNDANTPSHLLRRTMVQHADSVVDVCLRARYGTSVLERLRTKASTVLRATTSS